MAAVLSVPGHQAFDQFGADRMLTQKRVYLLSTARRKDGDLDQVGQQR